MPELSSSGETLAEREETPGGAGLASAYIQVYDVFKVSFGCEKCVYDEFSV